MTGGTGSVPLASSSIFTLAAMILDAKPATLGAMAQRWSDLAGISTNSADGMESSLDTLMRSWQSSRAQPAFESNTRPLIGTLRAVATDSTKIAVSLRQAQTDLQRSQTEMAALLAQANALIPNGPLDYANAAGQTTSQQLAALTQQAVKIIQALSDDYDVLAVGISSGMPVYAGPAGPANTTPATASQNSAVSPVSQIPTVPTAQASQSSPTASAIPASAPTSTPIGSTPTIPALGPVGTTVPTSTGIPTATLPTLDAGGIGTAVPTIPAASAIPTTPLTPVTPLTPGTFTDTFLPAGTLGIGGFGSYDVPLSPAPGLLPAEQPVSALPSQNGGSSVVAAEPPAPSGDGAAAPSGAGAGMPFLPGMPGGASAGSASGRRPKLGEGLFDDDSPAEQERRGRPAVRQGVIAAEEPDLPISAYGSSQDTVGPRRARARESGFDDGVWGLPAGLADPILTTDGTRG